MEMSHTFNQEKALVGAFSVIVTTSRRLVYSSSKESLSSLPPASPNVDRVEVHNREGNEVKSNSVSGDVTDVHTIYNIT